MNLACRRTILAKSMTGAGAALVFPEAAGRAPLSGKNEAPHPLPIVAADRHERWIGGAP